MPEQKKVPMIFSVLAVVLMVVPLGIAVWYFSRPQVETQKLPNIDELDVICLGRVDAQIPVVSLEPSTPGRVVTVFVEENAVVEAKQPIVGLDDSVAVHRKIQADAALTVANIELTRAKNDAERLPRQVDVRKAMLNAAKAQVRAADKNLESRKALSTLKSGDAEIAALQAVVDQLRELETAEQIQLGELVRMVESQQPKLLIQLAEARVKAAEADVTLAQKAVEECLIRAPGAGRILRLQATPGGILISGGYQPSIIFAPTGRLIIRAEIDQEFLGRVKPGQQASVEDDIRIDAPKITGKVKSIAKWVAQRRTMILDPGEINDVRTVECVIELDDDANLVIGQRMRIRVKTHP